MSPEFRSNENQPDILLPCIECGNDSDAYCELIGDGDEDSAFMCKACAEGDQS